MKKFTFTLGLTICLLLCFSLISCKEKQDNSEYLVTFNLMDGTYNNSKSNPTFTVKAGSTIDLITPSKYGHTLQGWTTHLVPSMVADFDASTKVTSNIVLYAVWKKPQLVLNNDGGIIPGYTSVDELIDDFLRDFNVFSPNSNVTIYSFFEFSYRKIISFFNAYYEKWIGLFNYLASVAYDDNIYAFQNLFTEGENENGNGAHVRAEIAGFLRKGTFSYGGYLQSSDYSSTRMQDDVFAYLPDKTPSFYVSLQDYTLPIPYKTGYNFIGWYDNNQFEGDPITVIKAGDTTDYEFFARWSTD